MQKDTKWKCAYCKKTFKEFRSLQQHVNSGIHRDKINSNTKSKEVEEKEKVKTKKEKSFSCLVCNKKFTSRSSLEQHKNSKNHKTSKTPLLYYCPICKRDFKTKNALGDHQIDKGHLKRFNSKFNIDLIGKEKEYKCLQCNKSFKSQLLYYKHVQIHNLRNKQTEIKEFSYIKEKCPPHNFIFFEHLGRYYERCLKCGKNKLQLGLE